ncbi:hypothetical protein BH23GEM3_BH23GEM3_22490 [soil metagenome]
MRTPLRIEGEGNVVATTAARTNMLKLVFPTLNSAVSTAEELDAPLILVAEDHPDSRDALRSLLEVYGFRVEVAPDGRLAVEKAIVLRPDLVLMDIMMPDMDGFEATRALRASSEFRQVPIVALTAMEGAREMVLAAGCDDYLPKPIDVRSFLGRVRQWLDTGRVAAS